MTPLVSVVMPVHNVERYLKASVDSILAQTFTDFEFIIVDDGSTDGSAAILDSYTDPRIVRLRNQTKSGLSRTLNKGVEAAQGTYIARMDGDDLARPDRLAEQVKYLEGAPEVGVLGGFVEQMDQDGSRIGLAELPTNPNLLVWNLMFVNILFHPTIMLRRAALEAVGGYMPDVVSEDYDLWMRLIEQGTRFAILPLPLLRYRLHPNSYSAQRTQAIYDDVLRVRQRFFSSLLGKEIDSSLLIDLDKSFFAQTRLTDGLSDDRIREACGLLIELYGALTQKQIIQPDPVVWDDLLRRITLTCRYSPHVVTPAELIRHWQSPSRQRALKLVRRAARLLHIWPEGWY